MTQAPQLSRAQIEIILELADVVDDVAKRMNTSPETVLKRAIGSYCAKFGGGGQRSDPDLTNIVAISSHQDQRP